MQFDFTQRYSLRDVIGQYMTTLGEMDEQVVVVNADLAGTCRNRAFVEAFPERSFNVGIAEQNLVSFAAGLAHEGFMPFAFTMAPFMSMRACEQCRTDVAYANLNVRLMATYAGVSGGISGPTHWSLEDCGIMSSIPNMTILEPCDPIQARAMLRECLKFEGPLYFRSSVEPVCNIFDEEYKYQIGKADTILDGDDATIICSGVTVQYAVKVAINILKNTGRKVKILNIHTIKPIDEEAVIEAAKTGVVVVAQDHNIFGGLGTMVAKCIAENGLSVKFKILGVPDEFSIMTHAPYLYHKYGIDTAGIEETVIKMMEER